MLKKIVVIYEKDLTPEQLSVLRWLCGESTKVGILYSPGELPCCIICDHGVTDDSGVTQCALAVPVQTIRVYCPGFTMNKAADYTSGNVV